MSNPETEPFDEASGEEDEDLNVDETIKVIQRRLDRVDPDNVFAIGCVVTLKEPAHFEHEDETSEGFRVRHLTDSLAGYESPKDVMIDMIFHNDNVEDMRLPTERPKSPLADLFE